MEFRLLGPFDVHDGGPIAIGGRQRRTLLCILLVHVGKPVSTDRLVEELWGDGAPPSARKTVQAHVAHLRRILNRRQIVIEASGDGYVAQIDPGSIDARVFEDKVEAARRLIGEDPEAAGALFREALGLFRGAPLAGVADEAPSLRLEADRLNEIRLASTEELLEADLTIGHAPSVVERAERFVAEYPLRERAWGLLMLALYRSGRQSDSLRAFGRVRGLLANELGIEPSPELRNLEEKVLNHDPDLNHGGMPSAAGPARAGRRNPYKGLRPFHEDDSRDFFGRDDLIRRIIEGLTLRGHGEGLIVLAGPSGAGKSSVVRAGVIPRLRDRGMAVAVMLPGTSPLEALHHAVRDIDEGLIGDEESQPDPSLVVVVDQAEELFTRSDRRERTTEFLDLVTRASPEGTLWLLVMRADFLEQLMLHPGMWRRLERSLLLTSGLQEHEVAAAITGPATRVGVDVSPELVAEITKDVAARPAALPLLQYALTENFERLRGSRMEVAEYRAGGGISGTLTRRADSMLEVLDERGREAARRILLRLVTVTTDGEPVRRRIAREALNIEGFPEEVVGEVIERLGTLRLLTFDQDPETGSPTIEVAHESLLQEWPRLRGWIDAAGRDLQTERRLEGALGEWVDAGREPSFLLRGARLEELEAWAQTSEVVFSPAQRAYMAASRERQDQEARTRRRRRAFLVGVLAAAALGMAVLALQARASAQRAVVRELVAASAANLQVDPELSVLLALEAVERSGARVTRDVEEILHTAVSSSRVIARVDHQGEGIAHVSPDGETFVMSAMESGSIVVRRIDTQEEVATLGGHRQIVSDAVYDPTGTAVATTSADGTVRISHIATGDLLFESAQVNPAPRIPAFSTDGSTVAASSLGGLVYLWDIASGGLTRLGPRPDADAARNLEFSPDDQLLLVATESGAEVWSVATGDLITVLAEDEIVFDVGFTPDAARVVVSTESDVQIWESGTWQLLDTYRGHSGSVWDFQISDDGSTVVSSGLEEALVWDLAGLETRLTLKGHSGTVDGIDLTPDGTVLVTASTQDGTARLWDMTPHGHHELVGLSKADVFPVLAVAPDGGFITAGGEAERLVLRRPPSFEVVKELDSPLDPYTVAFTQDGDAVVAAGEAGVELITIDSGTRIELTDEPALVAAVGPSGLVAAALEAGVSSWSPPYTGSDRPLLDNFVDSIAFHPQEPILAMSILVDDSSNQWAVEVWDVVAAERLTRLPVEAVTVAFAPDGSELITTASDGQSVIWDAETFEPIARTQDRHAAVTESAADPVRPEFATGGEDGILHIWRRDTGVEVLAIPTGGFTGRIEYSADGRYLVAGTPQGYGVYVRDVQELAEVARAGLTRGLTDAECLRYLHRATCPPT